MAREDLRAHPWWRHVPGELQPLRLREARRRALNQRLRRRRVRITALVAVYGLASALLLLIGGASLTLMALMPLVLLPAVGWLAWWLTWQEFHR